MALSIDEEFLRWLDPGLPSVFDNLKSYLKLKSQGLRANDVDIQAKGIESWAKWVGFWAEHDTEIYAKLKVE